MATDRVALSYQLLDLSLAIRPAVFLLFADVLIFVSDPPRPSSLELPLSNELRISKAPLFNHPGAIQRWQLSFCNASVRRPNSR